MTDSRHRVLEAIEELKLPEGDYLKICEALKSIVIDKKKRCDKILNMDITFKWSDKSVRIETFRYYEYEEGYAEVEAKINGEHKTIRTEDLARKIGQILSWHNPKIITNNFGVITEMTITQMKRNLEKSRKCRHDDDDEGCVGCLNHTHLAYYILNLG